MLIRAGQTANSEDVTMAVKQGIFSATWGRMAPGKLLPSAYLGLLTATSGKVSLFRSGRSGEHVRQKSASAGSGRPL